MRSVPCAAPGEDFLVRGLHFLFGSPISLPAHL